MTKTAQEGEGFLNKRMIMNYFLAILLMGIGGFIFSGGAFLAFKELVRERGITIKTFNIVPVEKEQPHE